MIYERKCNICGMKFRVNGWYAMERTIREHLEKGHSEEYLKLKNFEFEAKFAQEQVYIFQRELGF